MLRPIETQARNLDAATFHSTTANEITLLAKAAKLHSQNKLGLDEPRIALVVNRLSKGGEQLYQDSFKEKPIESEWTRLIRNEPDEHTTLGVLFLAMHARKAGWLMQMLPDVSSEQDPARSCGWAGERNHCISKLLLNGTMPGEIRQNATGIAQRSMQEPPIRKDPGVSHLHPLKNQFASRKFY